MTLLSRYCPDGHAPEMHVSGVDVEKVRLGRQEVHFGVDPDPGWRIQVGHPRGQARSESGSMSDEVTNE